MNEIEKNEILSQVSNVLQFCHEIVSRLSSTSPAQEVNNNHNLDKDAHKELIETITKFKDDEEEDDDAKSDDDLWWDSSSSPPQYYTLVFDDDDVSLYSLDTSYADMRTWR